MYMKKVDGVDQIVCPPTKGEDASPEIAHWLRRDKPW